MRTWGNSLVPAMRVGISTGAVLLRQGLDLLRDLLSVETAIILNAAFCERHKKHCSPSQQLQQECAKASHL